MWFTLESGRLSDIYYPDLGTPAVRELKFVVSDGKTFAERERTRPLTTEARRMQEPDLPAGRRDRRSGGG